MQRTELPPIPIPPKQRWREFRIAYLPPVTFVALVAIIAWMWMNYVRPSAIIGEVEVAHANIISTVAGMVQSLNVDTLQPVTNGQELAVVTSLDPEQLNAELAAAEADLRLMRARMEVDKTRNLDSYGQLRTDLLNEQLGLELARIHLTQAENEYTRAKQLFDSRLIASGSSSQNDLGLDVALRDRDSLRAEVASREKTVADLETTVNELKEKGALKIGSADDAVEQAIRAQHQRIEQLQKPLILRAPFDGFISEIKRRAGERIDAGGTVLVVSGRRSDRIVAWVHPPVLQRPQVGDTVEVQRMGMGQGGFMGTVVQVGSQLEPVSPMLRTPTANPERIEVGLPLLVQAADATTLIPGEAVRVRLVRHAATPASN